MSKIFYTISIIMFFSLGIIFGMIFQQLAVQATFIKVASNLEDTEINIDLNETKMVNQMKVFFEDVLEDNNISIGDEE